MLPLVMRSPVNSPHLTDFIDNLSRFDYSKAGKRESKKFRNFIEAGDWLLDIFTDW